MKLLTPLAVKSQLGDGGKEQDGFHMWARAMTMSHGAKAWPGPPGARPISRQVGCFLAWSWRSVRQSDDREADLERAHNPKVTGSNPAPATSNDEGLKRTQASLNPFVYPGFTQELVRDLAYGS
jgi:hypothetical protein